jgi:hypothetical protein
VDGPEFRVNLATTGDQRLGNVAVDGNGDFVVVWTNACTNCFEADFFLGSTRVSHTSRQGTFANQTLGGVAATGKGAGDFVIAFTTNSLAGAQTPTHVVEAIGFTKGSVTISSSSTLAKGAVDTAADRDGAFVAVWESLGQDGDGSGIYARRFLADFTPREAGEFRVNTTTLGEQRAPSVAMAPDGSYLVAWQSRPPNGVCCAQSFAQRYDAAGVPAGGEFLVSTNPSIGNYYPDVAPNASGGFVVVWNSYTDVGAATFNVLAKRYSANGAASSVFRVNGSTSGFALRAKASTAPGGFVVAWDEFQSDASGYAVFARQFASGGSPVTAPFRVNTYTTGNQFASAVAVSGGRYVIAWQSAPDSITSAGQDGSGFGVFAQKLCRPGDANVDGVVDIGDLFTVIDALFAGGKLPSACGADANGNTTVDVADVFYLINFLFAGGPPPVS